MSRSFELNIWVVVKVFVNILERRRRGDRLKDAETQPMSLIRLMVRILSDYTNLDFMDGRCFKCVENMFLFGVNLNKSYLYFLSGFIFCFDKFVDILKSFSGKELFKRFLPAPELFFELIKREKQAIRWMISFHIFLTNLIIRRELVSTIYNINLIMEVGELIKLQTKKKALKKQRQSLIHDEIKKRQRLRVNLDQSSVKKGFIEKHKYIAKKKFDTFVEKARKIPIQIQDNANPNTYLSRTSQYQKILERTKSKVELDKESLKNNIKAINSFGITNKQFLISFTLQFQKQIVCQPKPFLIKLPFPQTFQQIIIVLKQVKQKDQGAYSFESIKELNLKVMSYSEFKQKIRNDKIFLKKIDQQQIKCLVKFQLYKNNKFFEKLLKRGTIVFPIDSKKVPFSLQQQVTNYADYIQYMSQHYLALTKSGNEQIFRLRTGNVDNIFSNSMAIIYQLTSKLIERSKVKQNRLMKICAKTASSINFDLYQSK